MVKKFGLIGFPLTHSFSKRYFTEKFQKEGITDSFYDLYEIAGIESLPSILKANPELVGLNVTIPHKKAVLPFLSSLDKSAEDVGAVNVIKIENGKLIGYNSDYYGFIESLKKFAGDKLVGIKALILGTGGAAAAVQAALKDLKISFQYVSRTGSEEAIAYEDLKDQKILSNYRLLINTTPLGMYPKVDTCPPIPYDYLTTDHLLFDLVYNPLETLFLKKGKERGANTKDGLEMLHLQAEKAWEIWNS